MAEEFSVETLSVKFKIVEESLAQFKQALANVNQHIVETHKRTQEEIKQTTIDGQDLIEKFQEAKLSGVEMRALREQQIEYEKWQKIQKWAMEAKNLSDSQQQAIINTTNAQMDQLEVGINKARQGVGQLKTLWQEFEKATGINLGRAVGGAAVITGAFMAAGEMQKYERNMLEFEAFRGYGMDPNQRKMYNEWVTSTTTSGIWGNQVSTEEATRVGAALMRVSPSLAKPEDIFKKGGLADLALYSAPGAGIDTDTALEHMRDMMSKLRMPASQVQDEFLKLVHTTRALGDVSGRYMSMTIDLAKNMRVYNLDIDTAGKMVRAFWTEIRDGKMNMEDLNRVLKIGTVSSEGQRAFIGAEILAKDQRFADMFGGVSGLAAEQMTKRILMGNRLLGEGDVSDKEIETRRIGALQAIFGRAKEMGDRIGGNEYEKQALTAKFLQSFSGINLGNLSPEMEQTLISEIATGKFTERGKEALKMGMEDPTQAHLENIGQQLRKLDTSPLQKILQEVQNLVKMLGAGFMAMVSALRFDFVQADKYMEMIENQMLGGTVTKGLRGMVRNTETDAEYVFKQRATAASILNRSQFSSREEFEDRMAGFLGTQKGRSRKEILEMLEAGSLTTNLDGKLVFDFTNIGEFDVTVKEGKVVALEQRASSARPGSQKGGGVTTKVEEPSK